MNEARRGVRGVEHARIVAAPREIPGPLRWSSGGQRPEVHPKVG